MDICEIDISKWMLDNPGINPIYFFRRINYYTIDELKQVYKMLYNKNVRGRNSNNFNWIWKMILKKTDIVYDTKYQIISDLENFNKNLINENNNLRNRLKILEKRSLKSIIK